MSKLNIKVDMIPVGNVNRPGHEMQPKFITIHNTGNDSPTANAESHSRYIKKPSTQVSWHFTVDDKDIYQHLPLSESGWHAGDGNTGKGNRQSIGIEICMNKGIDMEKAEWLAARLTASLMQNYNIPLGNVVQHNFWNKKNCPQVIRARKNGWIGFTNKVQEASKMDEKKDVKTHWGQGAIDELKEEGLINTDHDPNKQVTWAEFAAVVTRIIKQNKEQHS